MEGYRPEKGQLDRNGEEVEDHIYNIKDFDRTLVLDERTKLVARKVTAFLKESGDRFQKAIVFCVDQEHAARVRQALINENADLVEKNHRYVMRITGADIEGQAQLSNFIDPESRYPVLVTTSRLLSTGVDVQTCRLIVLDREVGSMTEFKQIIGRGTRVHEDTRKFYFTLMDFRGATTHFADPDFDGEPVQIYEPGDDDPILPPEDISPNGDSDDPIPPEPGDDETVVDESPDIIVPNTDGSVRKKVYVDGVAATIVAERVEHARLGAILAAKPDGPPSYQVTHDDPVGVPLPDRDLVDADHFRSWRPGSSELLLHVLLLERLDRVPVQMQLLSNILDRRGSASTTDVEAKALGVERIVCEEVQLLLLHLAAAHTIDAADFEIQKRSGVAA